MPQGYEIIDESPFNDGVQAGSALGAEPLRRQTRAWLDDPLLSADVGAMNEAELTRQVAERLHKKPDDAARPELNELYPDRMDYLRGLAQGAACTLEEAAVYDYAGYLRHIRRWSAMMNPTPAGNCSAVLLVGSDGVVAGQNLDSLPREPRPEGYRDRRPPVFKAFTQRPARREKLVFKRPRSGYIEEWGTTNEHGVGLVGGGSCGTWLDEPIIDTWPIKTVPLLRFARNVRDLVRLYPLYRLYDWGRSSEIWADISGDAIGVEHSYQRAGIRSMEGGAIWATEGHFQGDEMHAFLRQRRLEYVRQQGMNLGTDDLQYATDSAVRFCHIGELAHRDGGRGLDHVRRIISDHETFPRAVCRHGGPDTDKYDRTVTMQSSVFSLTTNRVYKRNWKPWKRFCCQMPEVVTEYPKRPCDG